MQDRPDVLELLATVREFLHQELVPTLGDHRQKFRTLIAINVLGIVERELTSEEEHLREEWGHLVALEGTPTNQAPPEKLTDLRDGISARKRALCLRIQAGEADAGSWRQDVLAYAHWATEEKVRISNPRYLERSRGIL